MKKTLIVCLLSTAAAVSAQPLSFEQCIELALENNKTLAAADVRVEESGYELRSARANLLPSFSFSAAGLYMTADGTLAVEGGQLPVLGADGSLTGATAYFPGLALDYEIGGVVHAGIRVEQPLYMGGKVRTAYRMAKLGSRMAQESRRLTESEVIVETMRAYAALVRANQVKVVAERYRALLDELLGNVESAQRHGLKTRNDVLKVQVKSDESLLNLRRAENAQRLAMMNLCHWIGRPLTDRIEVAEGLSIDIPQPDVQAGIESRPEFALVDRKTELASQRVRLMRSERLPNIGLMASYGYTYGLQINDRPLFDRMGFMAGINVSVPIFHFGARSGKVRSAKAQLRRAQLEQAELTEQMTLELVRASNNLDEAHLEIRLAESSLLSAEENLRLSEKHYHAGMETLSDYLEAQALWQQASRTRVEAQYDACIRWIEYRKASGQLN